MNTSHKGKRRLTARKSDGVMKTMIPVEFYTHIDLHKKPVRIKLLMSPYRRLKPNPLPPGGRVVAGGSRTFDVKPKGPTRHSEHGLTVLVQELFAFSSVHIDRNTT